MPILTRTPAAQGRTPVPYPERAGCPVVVRYSADIPAGFAVGDIVELGPLPAYATILDAKLICDDVDSNASPTAALDVGLMSGAAGEASANRSCGNELFAADATCRTGGVVSMTRPGGFRLAPVEADRGVGLRLQQAIATQQAGARVDLVLTIVQ